MNGIEVGLGTVILVVAVAVGTVVALAVFIAILRHFLFICRPNEILIYSGRKHHLPDGSTVGYKVVRRGWATRTPLLETVSRMDMRLFMVEVSVTNAYGAAVPALHTRMPMGPSSSCTCVTMAAKSSGDSADACTVIQRPPRSCTSAAVAVAASLSR